MKFNSLTSQLFLPSFSVSPRIVQLCNSLVYYTIEPLFYYKQPKVIVMKLMRKEYLSNHRNTLKISKAQNL